jgi:hypothetical protein
VSNVTLNSSGSVPVIAAKVVTIDNGVVVTIGGSNPANVFTDVPNYTGSGGNASTTGIFAGAGATTQPLGGQPAFDSPTTAHAATRQSRSIASAGGRAPSIRVTDTSQLASLLDNATLGRSGKVQISGREASRNLSVQDSTRTMRGELHRSVDARQRSGVVVSRLQ